MDGCGWVAGLLSNCRHAGRRHRCRLRRCQIARRVTHRQHRVGVRADCGVRKDPPPGERVARHDARHRQVGIGRAEPLHHRRSTVGAQLAVADDVGFDVDAKTVDRVGATNVDGCCEAASVECDVAVARQVPRHDLDAIGVGERDHLPDLIGVHHVGGAVVVRRLNVDRLDTVSDGFVDDELRVLDGLVVDVDPQPRASKDGGAGGSVRSGGGRGEQRAE